MRPALGDAYAEENVWYRDEARALAPVRDAEAVIETFDRVLGTYEEQTNAEAFASIREALVARRDRLAEDRVDVEARLAALADKLGESRARTETWTLSDTGFDAVAAGFGKTYRRGRRAFRAAYDDPSPERFHELRKRVKYHRYQVRILRRLWRRVLNAYRKSLHDLTDHLGEAHDVEMLRGVLEEAPKAFGEPRDVKAFLALGEQRRDEHRLAARALAARVYVEKPKHILKRFRAYWEAWKEEAEKQ